ncbi:hypothetical protein ACH4VQ_35830, partial [Streptomyces anulatus]
MQLKKRAALAVSAGMMAPISFWAVPAAAEQPAALITECMSQDPGSEERQRVAEALDAVTSTAAPLPDPPNAAPDQQPGDGGGLDSEEKRPTSVTATPNQEPGERDSRAQKRPTIEFEGAPTNVEAGGDWAELDVVLDNSHSGLEEIDPYSLRLGFRTATGEGQEGDYAVQYFLDGEWRDAAAIGLSQGFFQFSLVEAGRLPVQRVVIPTRFKVTGAFTDTGAIFYRAQATSKRWEGSQGGRLQLVPADPGNG